MLISVRVKVCHSLNLVCTIHDSFTIHEAIIHILHSVSLHLQNEAILSSSSLETTTCSHQELLTSTSNTSSSKKSTHVLPGSQTIDWIRELNRLNNKEDHLGISHFGLFEESDTFEFNSGERVKDVIQPNQIINLRFKKSSLIAHNNNGGGRDDDDVTLEQKKKSMDPWYYPVESLSLKNVRQVLQNSLLDEFDVPERNIRMELAACYRLFDMFGWTDTIYGHLTARVPRTADSSDSSEHFLINPFGLLYSEITASSLVKIDLDGNTIHKGSTGDLFGINRAGYVIHSALHKARSNVSCVMHCHFAPASAISCLNEGLVTRLSQTCQILGDITYHDYQGIAVDEAERELLASDIGTKSRVLILKNHGVVTCGKTIGEAFLLMYTLTEAAKIQVNAYSASHTMSDISLAAEETTQKTQQVSSTINSEGFGTKELCAFMRKLDSIDPSYRL